MMGMVGLGGTERWMLCKLKGGIEKNKFRNLSSGSWLQFSKNTFQNTIDLNHRKRSLQPSPNSIDKIR